MARLLSYVPIQVRLLLLMAVAASAALVLAIVGVAGLSESKEILRSVYAVRMGSAQQLAEIDRLMLTNRLLMETALSHTPGREDRSPHSDDRVDRQFLSYVAAAIEKNRNTITSLWADFSKVPLTSQERGVAERFAQRRNDYMALGIAPLLAAMRARDYEAIRTQSIEVERLFAPTHETLEALTRLQFDVAHETYQAGVDRYDAVLRNALAVLMLLIGVMCWLGWVLNDSIVNPLRRVISIFKNISKGCYDTPIDIHGRDEISAVMRELQVMQAKLGQDESAIHQLAFYDALTHLPNRRLLRERLQQAMSATARTRAYGAVLMIDLDNFKTVNDTQGHEVGDRLLVEVAQRLKECVRQTDTVARLGGDEFVVLLSDLSTDEELAARMAERIGEKILAQVHAPCSIGPRVIRSAASIGMSLFSGDVVPIDDLFKRADISMYQAKAAGRNGLQFFDPDIQAALEARMALESELHEALQRDQFRLYFQVQVGSDEQVFGAEVLLRWEHPRLGLVTPDKFIPIAEETHLIVPMGEWVLRKACEQLRAWQDHAAAQALVLAVNVSARQFRQPDFVDTVERVLSETGACPAKLKLELTESVVLHDVFDTVQKMRALNALGVEFSMDDFGTGYSSLSHLSSLPIRQLKIDRSFVRNIQNSRSDAVIVQTIIGMASTLGVAVIAEGVETENQRSFLEQFGCMAYQGFLYGRPVPQDHMQTMLEEMRRVARMPLVGTSVCRTAAFMAATRTPPQQIFTGREP
ncbi:EAL domain-containing protein [Curvibacter sp. APW13]|uniref:putative bifunctional diguanylate cyclase/phosphodiesterase n=1 Tax=Curvibacter sp. APW13 TaxID=3077236 RepID=UPI0028E09958|nr:EAL domain-containing protein [Curvibacter sp. APW13]MDT8992306.1 EAL domain-containing protein [Curvibacter sp. APW13]